MAFFPATLQTMEWNDPSPDLTLHWTKCEVEDLNVEGPEFPKLNVERNIWGKTGDLTAGGLPEISLSWKPDKGTKRQFSTWETNGILWNKSHCQGLSSIRGG